MKYSGPGSAFMLRIKKQRELKTHLNKKVFHKEASIVFHDSLINNCGLGSSWTRETLGRSDPVLGLDPPEPDYLYVSYFVLVAVFFRLGRVRLLTVLFSHQCYGSGFTKPDPDSGFL
jgi:hypothetical protein